MYTKFIFPSIVAILQVIPRSDSRLNLTFAILAFLLGFTKRGVTSMIEGLYLQPKVYGRLLKTFERAATHLETVRESWIRWVFDPQRSEHLLRVNDRIVLVSDGGKVPKEGRRMPGVKCLHQESSNNSKPEYIMGHAWGALGVLVNQSAATKCVFLAHWILEGWKRGPRDGATWVSRLQEHLSSLEAVDLGEAGGYLLLDAGHSIRSFASLAPRIHPVVRLKSNAVAFDLPLPRPPGARGRKPKVGTKRQLKKEFSRLPKTTLEAQLYGEMRTLETASQVYLIRGEAGEEPLTVLCFFFRFPGSSKVLMLVSTDLELTALQAVELYALRFKIEVGFKVSKHEVGSYNYHFWSRSQPKLQRGQGDTYLHRTTEEIRSAFFGKIASYELYQQLGTIGQGLLSFEALARPEAYRAANRGFYRTQPQTGEMSEARVQKVLRDLWDLQFPRLSKLLLKGRNSKKVFDEKRYQRMQDEDFELVA